MIGNRPDRLALCPPFRTSITAAPSAASGKLRARHRWKRNVRVRFGLGWNRPLPGGAPGGRSSITCCTKLAVWALDLEITANGDHSTSTTIHQTKDVGSPWSGPGQALGSARAFSGFRPFRGRPSMGVGRWCSNAPRPHLSYYLGDPGQRTRQPTDTRLVNEFFVAVREQFRPHPAHPAVRPAVKLPPHRSKGLLSRLRRALGCGGDRPRRAQVPRKECWSRPEPTRNVMVRYVDDGDSSCLPCRPPGMTSPPSRPRTYSPAPAQPSGDYDRDVGRVSFRQRRQPSSPALHLTPSQARSRQAGRTLYANCPGRLEAAVAGCTSFRCDG